jgi:hypothetical protein
MQEGRQMTVQLFSWSLNQNEDKIEIVEAEIEDEVAATLDRPDHF